MKIITGFIENKNELILVEASFNLHLMCLCRLIRVQRGSTLGNW